MDETADALTVPLTIRGQEKGSDRGSKEKVTEGKSSPPQMKKVEETTEIASSLMSFKKSESELKFWESCQFWAKDK